MHIPAVVKRRKAMPITKFGVCCAHQTLLVLALWMALVFVATASAGTSNASYSGSDEAREQHDVKHRNVGE
eukprot:3565720-Rhodomonas_salina.1